MLREDLTHQAIKLTDHYSQQKNKKEIGLMKNELGWRIMTEIAFLRPKICRYLKGNGHVHKKAKGTNKCEIKQETKV